MIPIDLEGKVAFITGGSRGIGAAIVRKLVAAGAKAGFNYRSDRKAADELVKELGEQNVRSYQFSIDSMKETQAAVKLFMKDFGGIDILVNNAGINKDGFFGMMGEESWGSVINTNLNGLFNVSRSFIMKMISKKAGVIINISSIAGVIGTPGQVNYSTTKAGIIGFTKALSKECGIHNIRVVCVAPGFISTDMYFKMPKDARDSLMKNVPLGRAGNPQEVGDLIAFLASDLAGYITGQTFIIDGGLA